MSSPEISAVPDSVDRESRAWLERLRATGVERDAALTQLHALLLRAARFEVGRRHAASAYLRGGDRDDLAQQSADDALVAILGKRDDFRGESRFTTWAYKFALYEAVVKVGKRAWQGREVPLEAKTWPLIVKARRSGGQRPGSCSRRCRMESSASLSGHQREVLVAITLNGVPIDVLAARLNTTRGAIYKTVHDARHKLRAALAFRGLNIDERNSP
jgi:RNA polymerase sigma-70 factor (ECF subfamily)